MSNVYDHYAGVMKALDYIREGKTRTEACRWAGTTVYMFNRIVSTDTELGKQLVEAEQEGLDIMADMLANIDQHHSDPKMAAVISKNLMWLLDKRNRQKYGNKVVVDHNDTPDKAIINALNAAIARIPMPNHQALPDLRIIDVTPERETGPALTLEDVL